MEQLSEYSCKSNREGKNMYDLLKALFQSVKRLFDLAYFIAADAANIEAGTKDNR